MNDLDQALLDIQSIRRQVAQTVQFRGYGPLALSVTALFALAAGWLQAVWVPAPVAEPQRYVAFWLAVGVLSAAVILWQMLTRAGRIHSGMAPAMIWSAVTAFLPAAGAGVVLPFVLLFSAPQACWMLPGLWQVLFSLGVFASCRSLPRPLLLGGVWFLFTGLYCLAQGPSRAFAPAAMALPYGVGMALVAALHHYSARGASADDEDCL